MPVILELVDLEAIGWGIFRLPQTEMENEYPISVGDGTTRDISVDHKYIKNVHTLELGDGEKRKISLIDIYDRYTHTFHRLG